MKKQDLINDLSARTGILKVSIAEVLDAIAASAKEHLSGLVDFEIPGVVKLTVQARPERMGRNPATGEPVTIPAKMAVKAKVAAQIRSV